MRLSSSQRQLSIVRAQMSNRIREAKMQELTIEQLKGLGNETRVYKAVGKMYVFQILMHPGLCAKTLTTS